MKVQVSDGKIVLDLQGIFDAASDETRRHLVRYGLMDDVIMNELVKFLLEGYFEDSRGRRWGWLDENYHTLEKARSKLIEHADDITKKQIKRLQDAYETERKENIELRNHLQNIRELVENVAALGWKGEGAWKTKGC